MFLEFIGNHPEKFKNVICEIQELPSIKPETFLKNTESIKKNAYDLEFDLNQQSLALKTNAFTTVQC